MTTFNMRQLEDRARDVDPDLRYMALEDFQKYLNGPKSPQPRNVAFFVPILFQLLGDSATEVQNQAVKSFAPLVRHSSDRETLQIVKQLYSEVEKTANDSKFSTSVPTLALRSIFSESHTSFSGALSRDIFGTFLPQIFAAGSAMTIDKIEIFIDMIKNIGSALSLPELSAIVTSLIDGAFSEKGILGKRSIIAVDSCLSYVSHASRDQHHSQVLFYDEAVSNIVGFHQKTAVSSHSTDVFYTLLQVVLGHASAHKLLSEKSTSTVFREILAGLKLEQTTETDAEDLDIDVLVHTNLVRENALITLSGLMACFPDDAFIHSYAAKVFEIVDIFMAYDPLLYDDSEGENGPESDSEFDFSDDEDIEQYENTGENDALAAKLRLSALVVVRKMLQTFPPVLSLFLAENLPEKLIRGLGDRSEMVSNEAISTLVVLLQTSATTKKSRSRANSDVSMATESAEFMPFWVVARDYASKIEAQIFGNLLTAKHIARFSKTKVLIECLVAEYADELSAEFLANLAAAFVAFKLSLKTVPEIVRTYRVLFSTYGFQNLPSALADYIAQDLAAALSVPSTYHSVVSEILSVCGTLYQTAPKNEKYTSLINTSFFPSLAQNLRKREYASDLRQHLLDSLAELLVNIDVSAENAAESVHVLRESLNHEVSVNFTLETMAQICAQKPAIFSPELCQDTLETLTVYLGSSDASLYASALTLLDVVLESAGFAPPTANVQSLKEVLFALMKASADLNLIGKCFTSLGHLLRRTPADEHSIQSLITSVINTKFADVDDVNMDPLEYLTTQIAKHNTVGSERLYSIGMESLILPNFISAKIMALICTTCRIPEKVGQIERQLLAYINTPNNPDPGHVIFDIHFLGCMATVGELRNVTFREFFEIAKREKNDHICLAAARAMGLCVVRNTGSLSVLLDCYQTASAENHENRTLYLVALKQLLKERSSRDGEGALRQVWDSLLRVISSKTGALSHKEVSELKLAGDVLSSITEADTDGDYQQKILAIIDAVRPTDEHIIYTVVVIMKQLVGKSSDDFEVQIIERIMGYLSIKNLELKSAIVSTLLTGIYNKSVAFAAILNTVILPAIYEELTAKEEFKKTIPMGPYKYVVDEGLEVRKLSYELISAIIDINSSKMQAFSVDEVRVFEVLSEKGLRDSENEIINLTVYNLMQILHQNEGVLGKISNRPEMVAALTKIMNRKIRSKASTQETESFEDTLRSVIKLAKVMDGIFARNNAHSNEWSTFYHELKNKHHLLFSAMIL